MVSKISDDEIIALRNKGLLHREIAERCGLSTSTITNRLNKLGLGTYRTDSSEILELHNQGLYDHEIAEIIGCTRSNVTIALNKLGIRTRRSEKTLDTRNRISETLTGRFVGDKNPNYKGYNNEKQIARGIFKTISKRLIRNCDYRCAICGKRGGNLETHHIKPFSLIIEEFFDNKYNGEIDTIYDQLMSYHDFTDESNMVVVCHDCHKGIHYSDNPELSPYRWESATTIESVQ